MALYLYSTRYMSEYHFCQCRRSQAAAGSTYRARGQDEGYVRRCPGHWARASALLYASRHGEIVQGKWVLSKDGSVVLFFCLQ